MSGVEGASGTRKTSVDRTDEAKRVQNETPSRTSESSSTPSGQSTTSGTSAGVNTIAPRDELTTSADPARRARNVTGANLTPLSAPGTQPRDGSVTTGGSTQYRLVSETTDGVVLQRRTGDPAETAPVTGPEDPLEVTPERAEQIRAYDRDVVQDVRSPIEESRRVADALAGRSSLGELNQAERQLLMDTSVNRWLEPGGDQALPNYAAIQDLGISAASDPNIGSFVANDFSRRAIALSSNAEPGIAGDEARAKAATLAVGSVRAAGDANGQRQLLEGLGPQGSAALSRSLALGDQGLRRGGIGMSGSSANYDDRVSAANQLLQATTSGPPTAASSAFVDTTFAALPSEAYKNGGWFESAYTGNTQQSMARALAHHWHPNDTAARDTDAARLEGILRTDQGRELLTDTSVPLESRLTALNAVRSHPEWNDDFFKRTGDVYDNTDITFALAAPRARDFAALRGDTPRTLSGTDLENTIGYSIGFPPQGVPADETPAQQAAREEAVARGEHSYYRGEPAAAVVDPIARSIREVGGDNPQVTVLPVQYASSDTGPVNLPLFRVQDPQNGADRFVDNQGRIYQSFDDWKNNNQLPPGNMVYPKDGHLDSSVTLSSRNTPRTVDTLGEHLKVGLDTAALVGGTIAGGAILLGSGGTLAPVVVAGASAWGVYRGVEQLNDRFTHGQSINPLTDGDARGVWLGLGANALGLSAVGAAAGAARLASRGSALAPAAATAAGYLRIGAAGVDAAAAGDAGYRLLANWDQLSGSERANLALSVGFWGVGSAAAARGRGVYDLPSARTQLLGDLPPQQRAIHEAQLPASGAHRYVPPAGADATLPRDPTGAYVDSYGNRWSPDPGSNGGWVVNPGTGAANPFVPPAGARTIGIAADGSVVPVPPADVTIAAGHVVANPTIVKRPRGVNGGHLDPEFNAFLAGDPANGVPAQGQITASHPVPGLPGVRVVDYQLYQARPDGSITGTPGAQTHTKTLFDPAVWNQDSIARHIDRVFSSNPPPAGHEGAWRVSYGGVNYIGYFRNGGIQTFGVEP